MLRQLISTQLFAKCRCTTVHFKTSRLLCIQNNHLSTTKTSDATVLTSQQANVSATRAPNNESTILTEEEYLKKSRKHPDFFGSAFEGEPEGDEGDLAEEKYFEDQPLPTQKLRTKQYADMIKELLQKRKIKEAIDVLEVRMLKEDRVKPEGYIYNLLLGACGRVGYTKKAFSLFNNMKKRGLQPMGGTYTALFNACANSPWIKDGLTRAVHLRELMVEKRHQPNSTTYNAMIKAFGRCGDLKTAFEIVDEMVAKKLRITDDTINFLLQASISDKTAGFRHALLVWRKFIERNIQPTVFSYNLMLRSVRECGLGDIETCKDVMGKIAQSETNSFEPEAEKVMLQSDDIHVQSEMQEHRVTNEATELNLLTKIPYLGNIVSIAEITKPEERLLLVGGLTGFLRNMQENKCTPDIKTFTLLLDCIPSTLAAENKLLAAMKNSDVKPDIDFYNMLMKKRSMRLDYENAKDVMKSLKKRNMLPNVMTYGVLALSCRTKQEALELIDDMLMHKYRLNTEILGTLLNQACHHISFPYVLEMMEICVREEIKPNKRFLDTLEEFRRKCKSISNDRNDKLQHSVTFKNGFKKFRNRYKEWLKEIEIDDTEDLHPWHQYRTPVETDVRHYKDKEKDSHFKPIHKSLFRQKATVVKSSNKTNKALVAQ